MVLVAASHVLWVSFASVTLDASRLFKTSELSIGLLVSVGPLCSAALSIPAGAVADRVGYRTPLLWAGLATAVFAFTRAFSPRFPVLLALTVAMLIPQPFLINAVADLVNRHFPEGLAATATGIGTMSIFLGITIGVAATPPLASAIGVRGTQFLYAVLATVGLLAFAALAPRHVPERLTHPEELAIRDAFSRVVRSKTMWILSGILLCGFGLYIGMTAWLEEMLRPRAISASRAGMIAGLITVGGILGSIVLGALSDKIGRRKPFLMAAGVVAAPSLWLLGHLSSFGELLATALVMGFFLLAALPVSIAIVSEDASLGPQVASTAVGVILMIGNLGGVVVVAVMGALKQAQGNFSGGVTLVVVLALMAFAVGLALPEPARREPAGT